MDKIKKLYTEHQKTISISTFSILLVWLCISCFRIPYVGQFFDATIFSFLFGYAKYILYAYFMIVCIVKIINVQMKPLYSKRVMLFVILCSATVSVILGGVQIILYELKGLELINFYLLDVWYENVLNFSKYFIFATPNFIDGGLIGTSIAAGAGIFIIVLGILTMFLCYVLIFKSHANNAFKNCVQWFYNLKKNSSTKQNSVIETTHFKFKNKNNNANYLDKMFTPNKHALFKFESVAINEHLDLNQENILLMTFLENNNIVNPQITQVTNDSFFHLDVSLTSDDYAKMYALKDTLNLVGLAIDHNVVISEEMLRIEYPRTKTIANLELLNFLKTEITTPLGYLGCFSENLQPIIFDLSKHSNIVIFDCYRQHYNNCINLLIASISINYWKTNVEIFYLSPFKENLSILQTDCFTQEINDVISMKKYIYDLTNSQMEIIEQLKIKQYKNIYEWNDKEPKVITNKVIFVNNIDYIQLNCPEIFQQIISLKNIAESTGITLISIDKSKSGTSHEEMQYPVMICYRLDSLLSKKIFDLDNIPFLEKKRHAILFLASKQIKIKVIFPNMSDDELIALNKEYQAIESTKKI